MPLIYCSAVVFFTISHLDPDLSFTYLHARQIVVYVVHQHTLGRGADRETGSEVEKDFLTQMLFEIRA